MQDVKESAISIVILLVILIFGSVMLIMDGSNPGWVLFLFVAFLAYGVVREILT